MSESWYGRKSPQHACYYCVHCVCCGRLMISRWILTPSCKHWTVSTCDRWEILLLCHGATATSPSQWNLLTWYYTCSYAISILTAIWSSFVFMFLWGQKCASTAICQKKFAINAQCTIWPSVSHFTLKSEEFTHYDQPQFYIIHSRFYMHEDASDERVCVANDRLWPKYYSTSLLNVVSITPVHSCAH